MLVGVHVEGWHPLEWSEWAMAAATDRLNTTAWHDVHLAFANLGEALWWICVVDEMLRELVGESYQEAQRAESVEDRLRGLRYARNRFAHDGDVLEVVDAGDGPQDYGSDGDWVWRDLPPASTSRGRRFEREYKAALCGVPVKETLNLVIPFLRGQARHYLNELRGGMGTGVNVQVERGSRPMAVFGRPSLMREQLEAVRIRPPR